MKTAIPTHWENVRGILENSDVGFKDLKMKSWSKKSPHSEPLVSIWYNQPISFKMNKRKYFSF